ncbi:MAG: flagellar hook-associated protein FlgL [Steroidobacterales bacterium]
MRITQSMEQMQFLAEINTLQASVAQTQSDISSGLAFTTPSQDPTAAGSVDQYNQALAQSQQYSANASSAQNSLNSEGSALTQVVSQLQSLYSLALQANSGTVSAQNLSAIATQAQQIQGSLLALANTQDGSGNYIFGGFATQTQPFTATATGASYNGDQGQLQVQIAAGQTVAAGDNGDTVFNQVKSGNGTFTVTANAANTGTGLIGASSVTNPAAYAAAEGAGPYTIQFTSPTTYNIVNASNATVTSGNYVPGQAISGGGVQVTLSGSPATGDSFKIAPSTNQSVFTTVQNFISSLTGSSSATQRGNSIAAALGNIQQALNQVSTVQSSVGGRLNLITTQQSVATSQQTQLKASIGSLQGLDYAAAITSLDSQNTTLSAALQSYAQTQGLTLFKYL